MRVQPTDVKCRGKGLWKRAGDPVGLVNEADTSSSHLVISCSRARTRETKRDRRLEHRSRGLESGPHRSLLLEPCCEKRRWPPVSRLREPCGSEDRRDRREPYRGRNPHPQWSLGTVQSGPSRTWVQRWSCGRWTQRASLEGSPGSGTLYLGPQLWPQEVTVLLLVPPLGP